MKITFPQIIFFGFFAVVWFSAAYAQESLSDEQIRERCYAETAQLREKFDPIYNLLAEADKEARQNGNYPDLEKWHQEYDMPLFEAVKQAVKDIIGTDNYLDAWQYRKLFPQITEDWEKDDAEIDRISLVPTSSFYSFETDSPLSLWDVFTLTTIYENQAELTPGVFFQPKNNKGKITGMMGGGPYHVIEDSHRICAQTLPYALCLYREWHKLWEIMAIYSFNNEKARDLLFKIVTDTNETNDVYAYSAINFLPFFPDSGKLLPEIKKLIQNEIKELQKSNPNDAKQFVDENGNLKSFYMDSWSFRALNQRLVFLVQLAKRLEFNEKIPIEERERFDIFRRDLMMSLLHQNPRSEKVTSPYSVVKKGEEHFEIYMTEYAPGHRIGSVKWGEEDLAPYPQLPHSTSWQKRKEFYEHELANPRPIYTENQMEYLRKRIKELERK
ncbi:MAG: hypothetical protein ACRC2T_10300 [Thermoguttaceae bacterium]